MSIFYKLDKDDVLLFVKVIPNATKTKFGDVYNDMLKIFIDTAPENNKANKKLIKFLSKKLKVAVSDIKIERGEKSRRKIIRIFNGVNSIKTLDIIN